MTRLLVSSGSKYEDIIGFSRAVRVGKHISVSGTAPVGSDGETVGLGDPYLQTKTCLEIAKKAIDQAGGTLANVVRTRIMLVNIDDWQESARAHGEFFSKVKPACTFVEVKGLINKDWLVEIEIDCIVE